MSSSTRSAECKVGDRSAPARKHYWPEMDCTGVLVPPVFALSWNPGVPGIGRPRIDPLDSCISIRCVASVRRDRHAALEVWRERVVENLRPAVRCQSRGTEDPGC